jgi:hypothetical protein
MKEQWTKIIENEIDFILNFEKYEEEVNELLLENELNIQYPVTRFDSEEGRMYRSCPDTETQALYRIEKRESLNSLIEHGKKRISRFFRAYNKLNDDEWDLIYYTYFERIYKDNRLIKVLDYKSIKDLQKAREKVLEKLMDFYDADRIESQKEFKAMAREARKQRAKDWIKSTKRQF